LTKKSYLLSLSAPGVRLTLPLASALLGLGLLVDTSLIVLRLSAMVPSIGAYAEVVRATTSLDIGGVRLRVLRLPALLTSLTAAPEADDVFFVPLVEATAILQRAA
jgi:hypothetical protein